ncbi:MAG: O-antigen ligase family protein [Planctomycetales bacterium]|nr:O-antigen ligase family protein [Planctomycetales bacterium]
MPFLMLTAALALGIWAIIALVRGSVFISTALFLCSTSCLPAEFASVDLGGLTWTLDRLWFATLCAQAAIRWYRGEYVFRGLEPTDLAIGLFFIWLFARTITQPLGSVLPGQPNTLMHLVNGYGIPFGLYAILRTSKLDAKQLVIPLWIMSAMGVYLAVTAGLEIAKVWSLVFPRFIGDPALGIHFGRARGPMLQSVRLGICLIACWTPMVLYSVWLHPQNRIRWVAALGSIPLMWGAVFLTYTRSVWMGLGLTICILVTYCLRGLPQRAAVLCILFGVLGVIVIKGKDLVAFKREYSAAETKESTYMRAAFAYVSFAMIKDRPIAGFGFNQFQVYNRPYLADRSTNIRVESIRGYVHHNSYLSLLVDLGIVGFALYMFVLTASAMQVWRLWSNQRAPRWARGLAVIAMCIGGVHLIQMAFHEVSFSSIENGFLFSAIGLVMAANQQFRHDLTPPQNRDAVAS